MTAALEMAGVWKSYPSWQAGPATARNYVRRRLAAGRGTGQRWALSDIDLRVGPGEAVGLIGGNGAGKSTLLRLAAGLSRPTRGAVTVRGEVGAVLSLGEALDLTLTGAENAVTLAMIGGLGEREARGSLGAILDFAGLAAFADTPVRAYSEGMKLRLAFGVLAQHRRDVLLVDEVIAVGDLGFQARCLDHVRAQRAEGAALLFASHDLDRVAAECDRAVWIEAGRVRAHGPADDVVEAYRGEIARKTIDLTPPDLAGGERLGSQRVRAEAVRLAGAGGDAVDEIRAGDPLVVGMSVVGDAAAGPCIVSVSLLRSRDRIKVLDRHTDHDAVRVVPSPSGTAVSLRWDRVDLVPGDYEVEVGVYPRDWNHAYDLHDPAARVRVVGPPAGDGVASAPHRWFVGDR